MQPDRLKAGIPALLNWYDLHERPLPWRQNPSSYRVWISEIMLQQTRIEAVIPHYYAFLQKMPTVRALAEIPEKELLKCWEGLGYYSRARNLQKAAKAVIAAGAEELPDNYAALLALPGIGEYTAGAIASIAFGEAVPAVDGNVMRVLARLTADDTDVLSPQGKKQFYALAKALVPENKAGRYNQAIMELGETVCLPNTVPHCEVCPLAEMCMGREQGIAHELPVRKKLKARRMEEKTVFVIITGDNAPHILLHRRPKTGLLAGLFEFPNTPGTLTAEEALNYMNELGLTVTAMQPVKPARHIFTHIEWHMTGFLAVVTETPLSGDYHWITQAELQENYALPSAFRPFLPYLDTKI